MNFELRGRGTVGTRDVSTLPSTVLFTRRQTHLPDGITKSYLLHKSSITRDVLGMWRLEIPLATC